MTDPLDEAAARAAGRRIIAQAAPSADLPAPSANGDGARIMTAAGVDRTRVDWLWPGRLPLGKVVVLDGDPDVGKSTLSLDLAARVSTGGVMPDGHRLDRPGAVLLLSAEDSAADTICPRLDAAGADSSQVYIFAEVVVADDEGEHHRPPSLPADLGRLHRQIAKRNVRLVVIDVLMAYLSAEVNSHRDQDVRRVLHGLARIAEATNCCIVVVRHLNKSAEGKAIYRGGGSIGIVGAARVGLMVGRDPEDESRRILAVTKSNLARRAPALAYTIEDHDGVGRIQWLGRSRLTADQLTAPPPKAEADAPALNAATAWLEDLLAEGPLAVQEVKRQAAEAEMAWRTVRRAADTLSIVRCHVGNPSAKEQWWEWSLPARQGGQDAQGVQSSGVWTPWHLGRNPAPSVVDLQGNLPLDTHDT